MGSVQTPLSKAFNKKPAHDAHETPGPAAKPREPLAPIAPVAPVPVQRQAKPPVKPPKPAKPMEPGEQPELTGPGPKPPKPKGFKLAQSELSKRCSTCGKPLFQNGKFSGCACFRAVASSVKLNKTEAGLFLEFDSELDSDTVLTIKETVYRGR